MGRTARRLNPLIVACGALLGLAGPSSHARGLAAAGKVDITPALDTHQVYLAGFGARGRRPEGVHDPLYARIVVFSDGKKTVAIAVLDFLGLYRNDVQDLRRMTRFDKEGRYLFVVAAHQHSAPDTLGMWGPVPGVSGVDHGYMRGVKEKVAAKVLEVNDKLKPARLRAVVSRVDPRGLCKDIRDPAVIDPDLGVLAVDTPDGEPVATVVNWSCHAEVLDASNRLITADYPGALCSAVEERRGGTCVFLPGSVGGLMTPDVKSRDFGEARRIGSELGGLALKALADAGPPTVFSVGYKSETVLVPIENSRHLMFLPSMVFGHKLRNSSGIPLPPSSAYSLPALHVLRRLKKHEIPWIETEVSRLDLGPACVLGIPGEVFPELSMGGYQGQFRAGQALTSPANPDPPDLSRAPAGPYLKDLMPCKAKFVVGLANDELGYLVPDYDFKVPDSLTLLPRRPGHHYEETNSIGRSATRIVLDSARRLLQ
ncbi:MAG: hypothetical protein HY748_10095 [Elusimicrobia bacterium]|nr:hypothetical protein [Elusimicrobiota bacterium]